MELAKPIAVFDRDREWNDGFDPELVRAAKARHHVVLVDLKRLYTGE